MFRKHRPITIRLDPNGPQGDRAEYLQRLRRIAERYDEFDAVYASIESRLTTPDAPVQVKPEDARATPKPR
ncbi:MAG TPA: hypothetical protein PKD54_10830 [Pirellulaceae bacterium]|nr:hypothetical protein [Pirellulaceae bacterium]